MIRLIRDLRLIPIALIASACLLTLKMVDLAFDTGHLMASDDAPATDAGAIVRTTPDVRQTAGLPWSWARQMFNFPGAEGLATPAPSAAPALRAASPADKLGVDITGSIAQNGEDKVGTKANAEPGAAPRKSSNDANPPANGTVIPTDGAQSPSGAERAILERLQERRLELDRRARELDIREGLLQAGEKRVESRLAEIKGVEAQIKAATQKRNEAETARFKGLVTMYENMKPRDAAKIFDRLDLEVLIEVASQINPRRMSDILAQMSAESAERLTVELARLSQAVNKNGTAELPKIEGRPMSP